MDAASTALRVVNHITAMLAYWDADQKCVFANDAYREWFGRTPEEMAGISMEALLGPLYVKNLPYIQGALSGRRQIFERRITLPDGEIRESIATYYPDVVEGVVVGFTAHVADVTRIKNREAALDRTIQEAILVIEGTKRSFHSKELGLLRGKLVQIRGLLTADTGVP